jgi:putative transcription factor
MSDDWESKTVIGFKRQTAKVTKKDSELNGQPLSSISNISCSNIHTAVSSAVWCTSRFMNAMYAVQARRTGAVVATDKKISGGGNKANQGVSQISAWA